MNILLLKAIRIVRDFESQPQRARVFQEISAQHFTIHSAVQTHGFFRKHLPPISDLMIAFYGSLGLRTLPGNGGPFLAVAAFHNEARQVNFVRKCLGTAQVAVVSFPITHYLRPANLWHMLCHCRSYLRVTRRINRQQDFMSACRMARFLGCHFAFRRILAQTDYRAIVVASNYGPESLALRQAGEACGRRTVYISHARLGKEQLHPDLGFDLSLLSGQGELDGYAGTALSHGAICFKGFEGQSRDMDLDRLKPDGMTIGIFLTGRTNESGLDQAITTLVTRFRPARIIIRQHPVGLVHHKLRNLTRDGREIEVTTRTALAEDVGRCDLIFAGNSNVHLEALRMGVPTVYLPQTDSLAYDVKNFVENNVVFAPECLESFQLSAIRDFYDDRWAQRFRTQDASYGRSEAESEGIVRDALLRLIGLA